MAEPKTKAIFKTVNGNIFDSRAQVLVNPVNCVGTMGAGLAKQFAARYPDMNELYRQECRKALVRTGEVRLHPVPDGHTVANLPTKNHWRNPSTLLYVKSGLQALGHAMLNAGLYSVAVPALGTGLGGLRWNDVEPLIRSELNLEGITVEIYPPR